jgi:hypothetical protein
LVLGRAGRMSWTRATGVEDVGTLRTLGTLGAFGGAMDALTRAVSFPRSLSDQRACFFLLNMIENLLANSGEPLGAQAALARVRLRESR